MFTDEVLAIMQEAAETAILPRFRALSQGDIEEKSPGEVVTRADREAEALIASALNLLRPDAIVVGEESAAANPGLVDAVASDGLVWLVDPLDGTANFIAGTHQFAVMVALVQKGVTTHAWIWRPIDAEAWVAERGGGTLRNGVPVATSGRTRAPGSGCAGFEYPELAPGVQDFVLFRRTLPWDHAPGALILQEAGGIVRRWDGSEYAPGDGREGIVAAYDTETWGVVETSLLQARHRASGAASP